MNHLVKKMSVKNNVKEILYVFGKRKGFLLIASILL